MFKPNARKMDDGKHRAFWHVVTIPGGLPNFLKRVEAIIEALGGRCPACDGELTTITTDVDNFFRRVSHWGCEFHGGGASQATQIADFRVLANPLFEKTDGTLIVVKAVQVGPDGDGRWHPKLNALGVVHGKETHDSYKSHAVYLDDAHDGIVYTKVSISWGPDGGSSSREVFLTREEIEKIILSGEPDEIHNEGGDIEHYWYVEK